MVTTGPTSGLLAAKYTHTHSLQLGDANYKTQTQPPWMSSLFLKNMRNYRIVHFTKLVIGIRLVLKSHRLRHILAVEHIDNKK